ncbi:MAG: hypothetical protein AAF489_17070 [Bacteroidota bacterium]
MERINKPTGIPSLLVNSKNKKYHLIFIAIMLINLMSFSTNAQNTHTMKKTFTGSEINEIEVSTTIGNIFVEATDTDEIEVNVIISKGEEVYALSHPNLDVIIKDFDMNISKNGNKVFAVAKDLRKFSHTDVSLSGRSDNIVAYGQKSDSFFSVFSSKKELITVVSFYISVPKNFKAINASSTTGNVILKNKISNATVNISSGGDISVKDIAGNIDAYTRNGSIALKGSVNNAKARTTGYIYATLNKNFGDVNLLSQAGSGAVICQLSPDMKANLVASGRNVKMPDSKIFSGSSTSKKVEGELNGGGNPLTIKASGNVTIDFL